MNGDVIRVAVISDTHGLLRRSVVREVQGCACILHAGDIIHESDLDELALYGSLYAVRGNNDVWMNGVKDLAGFLRFRADGVLSGGVPDPHRSGFVDLCSADGAGRSGSPVAAGKRGHFPVSLPCGYRRAHAGSVPGLHRG